jgi:hypothetical protein
MCFSMCLSVMAFDALAEPRFTTTTDAEGKLTSMTENYVVETNRCIPGAQLVREGKNDAALRLWKALADPPSLGEAIRVTDHCLYSMKLLPTSEPISTWLLPLAKQGNVEAQGQLGAFYFYGRNPRHLPDAVTWLTKSARGNLPDAQILLGVIYAKEPRVKSNTKARYWLNRAAKQGDKDAKRAIKELDAPPKPPDMPIIEPVLK